MIKFKYVLSKTELEEIDGKLYYKPLKVEGPRDPAWWGRCEEEIERKQRDTNNFSK